jgi:hypothetical protein
VYSTPARLNGEHLERKSRDEMYGKIKGRGVTASHPRGSAIEPDDDDDAIAKDVAY